MENLSHGLLTDLSSASAQPCLALYQPTHRHHPENQQDLPRFRNLLKDLSASLEKRCSPDQARQLLEPFQALARDKTFWQHTLDGLAVLGAPGIFHTFRFPLAVSEISIVADSFHIKPLRRFLQSIDRYQVLALSLDKIRLFEGNRHVLDELDLVADVPRTIDEALGAELTEPHQTVASYGGVGGGQAPMRHSQGGKKDEIEKDAERFFRAVDRAVLEHYSKPSGLPLILAALPEHHHLFHEVSQNPHLTNAGIRLNPQPLSTEELRGLAWRALEPDYQARLAALTEEFEEAQAQGTGSADLAQVAQAAATGKVATLLIEANREIPGELDNTTGRIVRAEMSDPKVDDLLDDLGELVAKRGGNVLVLPTTQMPTQSGLAATYRY